MILYLSSFKYNLNTNTSTHILGSIFILSFPIYHFCIVYFPWKFIIFKYNSWLGFQWLRVNCFTGMFTQLCNCHSRKWHTVRWMQQYLWDSTTITSDSRRNGRNAPIIRSLAVDEERWGQWVVCPWLWSVFWVHSVPWHCSLADRKESVLLIIRILSCNKWRKTNDGEPANRDSPTDGFLKGGDVDDVGDIQVDTIQEYWLKSTHSPVAS